MQIALSSGHSKYIRGASGAPVPPQLDEVDEARRVVERVADFLEQLGVGVKTFHDDVSTTQNENLNRIVDWHNKQGRDLDVSVHFNAYNGTAHGVECLYVTQEALAGVVASKIAAVGFTNRGAKYRDDLFFLGNTNEPAILIETCFCDNTSDSNLYRSKFEDICRAIAEAITGMELAPPERPEDLPPIGEQPDEPNPPSDPKVPHIAIITHGEVVMTVNGVQIVTGQERSKQ
jgi:N-acetylmuramoyl-L-alanine amidase